MTVYETLQKRRLEKIQNEFISSGEIPDIDDEKRWKKLWNQGVKIEATYAHSEYWNEVTSIENGGVGHSFTHATGTVNFRRKK